MTEFINEHVVPVAKDILFAAIVLIVGLILIRIIRKTLSKSALFSRLDPSANTFILSTIRIILYILLIIIIISILGVPMTSIIAALSSAFLAIGLALQGALSNFAGGIMLLVFRPFKVGDYISCTGGRGTVKEISVIYTSLITDDNNRITVPNGTLMNDSVTNYTVEGVRRVEIVFSTDYSTSEEVLRDKMIDIAVMNNNVLSEPAPDFKTLEYLDNGIKYSLRMWCNSEHYSDVYYSSMHKVNLLLKELGVSAPTAKVNIDGLKQ